MNKNPNKTNIKLHSGLSRLSRKHQTELKQQIQKELMAIFIYDESQSETV